MIWKRKTLIAANCQLCYELEEQMLDEFNEIIVNEKSVGNSST